MISLPLLVDGAVTVGEFLSNRDGCIIYPA